MKLGSLRALAICGALLAVVIAPIGSAGARSTTHRHCAYRLVPESRPRPHVVSARLEKVGCYATFSGAIEAGTQGAVRLPASITPTDLSESLITGVAVSRLGGDTLIGTEFNQIGYGGSSKNYFAPNACSGVSYEVDYVTDTWNDQFASGKGFGGCDSNRKFAHANFGGNVVTCSPNCGDYGGLRNEVSSLKWKP
jgi:hypothetical protein